MKIVDNYLYGLSAPMTKKVILYILLLMVGFTSGLIGLELNQSVRYMWFQIESAYFGWQLNEVIWVALYVAVPCFWFHLLVTLCEYTSSYLAARIFFSATI